MKKHNKVHACVKQKPVSWSCVVLRTNDREVEPICPTRELNRVIVTLWFTLIGA